MQPAGEDGKSLVCSPDTSSLKVLILTLLLDWWPAFGIYRIDDLIFIFIVLMTCRNFPMSMTGCLLKMSSSLHSSNRQLRGSAKCQKYKKCNNSRKLGILVTGWMLWLKKASDWIKRFNFPTNITSYASSSRAQWSCWWQWASQEARRRNPSLRILSPPLSMTS